MRYTESDLVIPTLEILDKKPSGISTSDLIKELTIRLRPIGVDAQILANRKDTRFSQKVRNLKSHDNLTRKELATYKEGVFEITEKGKEYLMKGYKEIVHILQDQGFSEKERENEFKSDYKDLIIEEGTLVPRSMNTRKRSGILTLFARKYFTIDGKIPCRVCHFDFQEIYGLLGKGYIEIHHTNPIHKHDLRGEKLKLGRVLKKLVPLCSNCHSMTHRQKGQILSIKELTDIIRVSKK